MYSQGSEYRSMDDLKFNLRHAEYLYSLGTERLRARFEKNSKCYQLILKLFMRVDNVF